MLICPECRRPPEAWPIDPDTVVCTNPACLRQYPKPDPRIPLVVAGDFEPFAQTDVIGDVDQAEALRRKIDALEVGGSAWEDVFRATMYVVASFAERPSIYSRICDALLPAVEGPVEHAVDLGCGVGGLAVELADRTGAHVVGLDSSVHALRWAERASQGGELVVPVRDTARSYTMRRIQLPASSSLETVSWVCGDVMNPPLPAERYDLVGLVNVLDSVRNPYLALGQASALLREGGYLILAQPDAWSADVVPAQHWLADDDPGWDEVLARVGLSTLKRVDSIDWVLERTNRVRFGYRLHARLAIRGEWKA